MRYCRWGKRKNETEEKKDEGGGERRWRIKEEGGGWRGDEFSRKKFI